MFIILILLAVMGLITTDIFVPSLPTIGQVFHQSPNQTELTISLFLLAFALSQLFYGPVSDRFGRRPPLIFSLSLYIVGSLLCLFAPSFFLFCSGRVLQGLAVGGGLSLSRVVLRDSYSGQELAVKSSQMAIFVCLTPAFAPLIGGFLQAHFGFRSVFVILVLYGVALWSLLVFYFKETVKEREPSLKVARVLRQYRALLCNFQFMRYVIITGLGFSAIILYVNILPFIIQGTLHLSAKTNGEILLFAASGLTIAALVSSRAVKEISPRSLLRWALILLLIAGGFLMVTEFVWGTTLFALIPCIFLTTFACGFIFPNALALSFSEIQVNIGVAGAIYGFTQTFTSSLFNFSLNFIPHQGQMLLGLFYVGIAVLGLLLRA